MLDDYKESQKISYKILLNTVKKNKNSHAYIFETKGYGKSLDFAIAFAKYLLCPNKHTNSEKCKDCLQCKKIDAGNFTEIKIIEADGAWIKKEQLLDLKEEFSKKSLDGNKKVYIINNAEKLNPASSNSLLKFLEEPEDNIIAILITNNKYQLLNTIISRCQIITLNNIIKYDTMLKNLANILYNDQENIEKYISDENVLEKISTILKFIIYYEKNGFKKTYSHLYKIINSYNYEKNELFEIIINFYKDVLNYKLNRKIEVFIDKEKEIKIVAELNDINSITKKIMIYLDIKNRINYNANSNLIMDKLLIELGEIE